MTERPRGFFERFTEPFTDRAKAKIGEVEDKVRSSVQAEIDAVGRAVKAKAVEARPSAIAFSAAGLAAFFGAALLITAAVVGLAHAVPLWAALLIVAGVLLLGSAAAAAWGKAHLPVTPRVAPPALPHPAEEQVHPWAD